MIDIMFAHLPMPFVTMIIGMTLLCSITLSGLIFSDYLKEKTEQEKKKKISSFDTGLEQPQEHQLHGIHSMEATVEAFAKEAVETVKHISEGVAEGVHEIQEKVDHLLHDALHDKKEILE